VDLGSVPMGKLLGAEGEIAKLRVDGCCRCHGVPSSGGVWPAGGGTHRRGTLAESPARGQSAEKWHPEGCSRNS
jgi:hypothetical protein